MKKRVYLVRHGESVSNAGGLITPGDSNPLSEKGIEQAKFVAKRAMKLPIEIIISSTVLRARQTAEQVVDATGKELETSDLFTERLMPSEQFGKTIHDPDVVRMEDHVNSQLVEHEYRYADEENFADLKKRAQKGLAFLVERKESEILLVTHGLFLRILVGIAIFGEDFTGKEALRLVYGLGTTNTGITILEYDDGSQPNNWRMRTWNDHAHLG